MEITDRIEESLADQFEPDTLLPVQYYELMRRRHVLEGERKLMLAVLEDAVECFLKNMNAKSRRRRVLFYEAQNWMDSKNRIGLFTYDTLCEALEIQPRLLRGALQKRLMESRRAKAQAPIEAPTRETMVVDTRTSDIAAAAG